MPEYTPLNVLDDTEPIVVIDFQKFFFPHGFLENQMATGAGGIHHLAQ